MVPVRAVRVVRAMREASLEAKVAGCAKKRAQSLKMRVTSYHDGLIKTAAPAHLW